MINSAVKQVIRGEIRKREQKLRRHEREADRLRGEIAELEEQIEE